jgi:enoyl-CoA hydratase
MQVTTETHDGIVLVRMDDGKMNAVTQDALGAIDAALDEAETAAALVVAGRPGSFCAGFDRAVMTGDDDAARAALGAGGARIAARLFAWPKPVVAASTGHAFTIGALWLMACDTRIAERGEYRYAMTETVMGAILSGWPLTILETRVPPRLMTPIAVQSLVLGPEDAVEAGYVDRVVDAGRAVEAAVATAVELARLPAAAYAGNKRSVRGAAMARLEQQLSDL